jgi:hypothetical protein
MATRERTHGIQVHSPDLHEALMADFKPTERVRSSPGRREARRKLPETKRPWSTPVSRSSITLSANSSRSSLDQSTKIQNWLCQKSIRGVQVNLNVADIWHLCKVFVFFRKDFTDNPLTIVAGLEMNVGH